MLGPPIVTWEAGEPPRFRSQRTVALLAYLAAEQRPVSREALCALLWPDNDLSAARAALRRALHNLGKVLPGCWQADRSTAAFTPDARTQADIYRLLRLEAAEVWTEAAELVRAAF